MGHFALVVEAPVLIGRLKRPRRAGVDAAGHAGRGGRHSKRVAHDVGFILSDARFLDPANDDAKSVSRLPSPQSPVPSPYGLYGPKYPRRDRTRRSLRTAFTSTLRHAPSAFSLADTYARVYCARIWATTFS